MSECTQHHWPNEEGKCPYCEIERLRDELGKAQRNADDKEQGYERVVREANDLRAELDDATKWNHSVRVCKDHTADIVDGECVICELAEKDKRIEELELEIRSILNDEVLLIPIAQIDMLWKRRSFYRVAALRAIDDCLDAINVGECEECGGSGVVREHERGYEDGVEDTCPTCHGHGWIITSVDVDKYGRIGTGEE